MILTTRRMTTMMPTTKMTEDEVLLHLLRVSEHLKYVAHHQVVSRYVLESLQMLELLPLDVYKKMNDIVSANKLPEYDHLLAKWKAQQLALMKVQEVAPQATKVHVSVRPKPRRF
jgi:hypothetical protein